MYCRDCGEKIDEYTKFCPKCGMKQKRDEIRDHTIKKKSNSNIWIIMVILLIVASIWIIKEIAQREALKNIEISMDGINVRSIGLTSATLDIKLKMYNPNIITATLDRVEYNLYGNDINLGNGIINQRVDIPSRTTRTITTNFDISYGGTIKVIWSGLQQGNVNWKMDGVAHFDTLLGTIDIPFSKRQGESTSNTRVLTDTNRPITDVPTHIPSTPEQKKYDAVLEIFNLKMQNGPFLKLLVNNKEFICDNGYKCRIHVNIEDQIYIIIQGGNYDVIKDIKLCGDIYCRQLLSSNQVYRGAIKYNYQSIYTWGGVCGNIPDCGVTDQLMNMNEE